VVDASSASDQEVELNALHRFWDDERGAEAVEWALVTATLLVMTVVPLLVLKDGVLDLFRQAFTAVQRPPVGPGDPQYP